MIWLFPYHIPYQPSTNIIPRAKAPGMILVSRVDTGCDTESSRDDIGRGLIRDVIRKEPYHILYIPLEEFHIPVF
jgi:hypothetical protein